jgi:hypothetical protein
MFNATHGPGGAFGGVVTLPLAPLMDRPLLAGLWVGAWSAGALLPDSDHPASSTARMWGPLTSIPCRFVGKLAGGHRNGTHDISKGAPLWFALVAAAGWLAGIWWPYARIATVAVVLGLAFLALAAWLPGHWEDRPLANLAAAWGGAVALIHFDQIDGRTALLLAAALAGGVLFGGIGLDALTISGVPFFGEDRHLLPRGFRLRTGGPCELLLRAGLWVAVPVLAAWLYGVTPDDVTGWVPAVGAPSFAEVAAWWR